MRGSLVGQLSLSLSVVVAVQLAFLPASRAQNAPAPAPGEPQVTYQDPNAAPPPPPPGPPGAPAPYAPPGQPGQPMPGPPGPPGPPPAYAGPFVTLNADNPRARLQVMGPLKWQDVCITPCNRPVNPQGLYRVGGGSIRPSETFNMPRPSGRIVIDTQVGSTVKHWVGIGLIIGGAAAAAGGALYYAGADDISANGSTNTTKGAVQTLGIVYIVTGVVLLAIGIPLAASTTSVEVR